MLFYVIYIFVIAVLLLIDYSRKSNGKIASMALFIVIIVSGIRENVGYDFANYVSFYLLENASEPGFNLINRGLKLFGLNYHWMFILFSFATIIFVFKGIKYYTLHTNIAFFIYILIPGLYLNSFSIVRQAIAIAILFYGYRFLYNKKLVKYTIIVIAAASFHYSSLFAIPFFLVSLKVKKMKYWIYYLVIIASIFLSKINFIPMIFEKVLGSTSYLTYAAYDDGGISFSKILILNIFILIILFFYKRMSDIDKTMFFFLVLAVSIVTIFGSIGAVTRFSYYFRIFEIILISDVIYLLKSKYNKLILLVFVLGYYGIMFFHAISYDLKLEYFPKMTPYQTMFE
ncbi:Transmembrane protein EpsG [termite gut metagenome]|uniref:Transmembrane protein EpsG n=1 Tax=termite gut metagenome TaxID=433724 RepID=A0A5J4T2H7_9ZZZZ